MNKKEAIKAMLEGEKITHLYFDKKEWITMNNKGYLLLEDGVQCSLLEFFKWRPGDSWNDGYSIYTDND